jgi:RNA polymerase primary sigma factor
MKQINFKEKRITNYSAGLANLFILARKYPVLSKQEEQNATEEQLINHNLLFVISVAKRYHYAGIDLMDLIQEGRIGLIKAARNYDSSLGFRFISYAVTKIQAEIIRFLESKCDTIRIPDAMHRVSWKLENLQKEFETVEETAKRLGIVNVKLENHINRKKILSFSLENSDGETFIDVPGDMFADSLVKKQDVNNIIKKAISMLPDREQKIINMRFFLNVNLSDVSKRLGVCRERIRQIESLALKKLKLILSESM